VYALGERSGDDDMSDHGWITNARTREKVWRMDEHRTVHAGGASKNRLADEVITLPAGDYIVSYQSDDSHSYDDWNSSMPYDADRWGITIRGVGPGFDPASVTTGPVPTPKNVLAEIVRVRDDRHERRTFTVKKATKVRIYAIGEGSGGEMADYGWIEEAEGGRVIWEMTYRMTERAGGASKNRMVERRLTLEPGEYELHFRTDGSHSFNDWNSDAPEDPEMYGITLFIED
jgi:hypothetical protein